MGRGCEGRVGHLRAGPLYRSHPHRLVRARLILPCPPPVPCLEAGSAQRWRNGSLPSLCRQPPHCGLACGPGACGALLPGGEESKRQLT